MGRSQSYSDIEGLRWVKIPDDDMVQKYGENALLSTVDDDENDDKKKGKKKKSCLKDTSSEDEDDDIDHVD